MKFNKKLKSIAILLLLIGSMMFYAFQTSGAVIVYLNVIPNGDLEFGSEISISSTASKYSEMDISYDGYSVAWCGYCNSLSVPNLLIDHASTPAVFVATAYIFGWPMQSDIKTITRTVIDIPSQDPPTLDLVLFDIAVPVGEPLEMNITTGGDNHGNISNAIIEARVSSTGTWIGVGNWTGLYGETEAEFTISQAQVDSGDFDLGYLDVRVKADFEDYTNTVKSLGNPFPFYRLTETPLDFSGELWHISSFGANSLTSEYHDYRETIKISKPMEYRSRIYTEFSNYSNQPLEVVVSYKGTSVNAEDHEFAPSLMLDFDSNAYARLSVEKNVFSYTDGEGGLGSNTAITPLLNTWYDLRIQLSNNESMTGYLLSYSFKLSSESSWTYLATYTLGTSLLGTPTVALGTHNGYSEENVGATDTYHFSNFMMRYLYDQDGDGLTDHEEYDLYLLGTLNSNSMFYYDTDGDGLSDAEELSKDPMDLIYTTLKIDGANSEVSYYTGMYGPYHSNPLVADTDGDGLSDLDEKMLGSNPNNNDTDFDGVDDNFDSQPTVEDTFAPSYVNINGTEWTFGDGTVLHPEEANEGDGVYLHIEEVSGDYYMVMRFYDDDGIDNVHIWSTSLGFWDFNVEFDIEGNQYTSILMQVNFPDIVLFSYTIHIQAEDVEGRLTDEITFVIDSTFMEYFGANLEILQFGVNWITDKTGDFISWVGGLASEALDAALTWLEEKAKSVMKFVKSKVNSFANPIALSQSKMFQQFIIAFTSYDGSSSLLSIRDSIFSASGFLDTMQPLTDFLVEYKTELDWVETVLELIVPGNSYAATFALSLFESVSGDISSDDILPFLDPGSIMGTMGTFIGQTLLTTLPLFGFDANAEVNLGMDSLSVDTLDLIITDMATIADQSLLSFITGMYDAFIAAAISVPYSLSLNQGAILTEKTITGLILAVLVGLVLSAKFIDDNTHLVVSGIIMAIIGGSIKINALFNPRSESQRAWDTFASLGLGLTALNIEIYALWLRKSSSEAITKINLVGTGLATLEILLIFLLDSLH